MKKLLLLFAMVAYVGSASAWDYVCVKIGNLYYNLNATTHEAEVTYKSYSYQNSYNEDWDIPAATIPMGVSYNSEPYNVKSIGRYAFFNCSNLSSVTISSTIDSIGDYAFSGCTALTSIRIPGTVNNVGFHAFSCCTGLTSLTIGNGVVRIKGYAFEDCTGLTSVTIPNSVTSISYYVFSGCSNLTSVTIGNGLTSIGIDAFKDCNGLTSVYIIDLAAWSNISFIQDNSNPLYYAHHLYLNNELVTEVAFPDGIESIAAYAFYGCTDLTSVTIPKSVTSIGDKVFYGCTGITSVVWNARNCNSYPFGNQVESFIFGNEVEVIPARLCYNMNKLESITIPTTVTQIGNAAFSGCTGITSVVWNARACNRCEFGNQVQSFVFGNEVEIIPWELCKGMSKLTSITIPNSVTLIRDNAFEDCSGLVSLTMGNSIERIESWAFNDCENLTNVFISDLTAWCRISFELQTSNPLYYARHLYLNDELVTDLVIPDGIENIGAYAFASSYRRTKFTSVTIPNSVTSMGLDAFHGCELLTAVYISDIAAWCKISFSSYSNPLKEANHLYLNGELVTDLVIPDGVESIGQYAFDGCTDLKTISFGKDVASIGDRVLYNCWELESITCYAQNVPRITEETFEYIEDKQDFPLYVPEGCEQAYLDDEYWSEFNVQVIGAEAIENIRIEGNKPTKLFHDGQVYILRGENAYTLQGQEAK